MKHPIRSSFILLGLLLAIWGIYRTGASLLDQYPPTPSTSVEKGTATHSAPQVPTTAELFALTNAERQKAGIAPLVLDERLDASAGDKCADMVKNDYWAHDTPAGIEPWTFIDARNIPYQAAGENLEYGVTDNSQIVSAWMASPTHKQNIVNHRYTNVGYAVCHSDNYQKKGPQDIVVQHFTGQ